MPAARRITPKDLVASYDAFLIDAYGVLVHQGGALPGAHAFLERLTGEDKPWLILSNDASRLPATTRARYERFGLPMEESRILTSGMLLAPYFHRRGLVGERTIVLGTSDSVAYVVAAGGVPTTHDDDRARVVVVGDDDGYPFLESIEAVLTTVLRRIDRGDDTELVLPNPDLIYPKTETSFGLTAGSVALLIEAAIETRHPDRAAKFVGLGKPHAPIFEEAFARLHLKDRQRAVMIGDQLRTDIDGARNFGIDSALVTTGLTHPDRIPPGREPTWILESF